jgi:hypothetical protein
MTHRGERKHVFKEKMSDALRKGGGKNEEIFQKGVHLTHTVYQKNQHG